MQGYIVDCELTMINLWYSMLNIEQLLVSNTNDPRLN